MAVKCPKCDSVKSKVIRTIDNYRQRQCLDCQKRFDTRELHDDTIRLLVKWINAHNRLWDQVAGASELLGVQNLPPFPQDLPLTFGEDLGGHVPYDVHSYENVRELTKNLTRPDRSARRPSHGGLF